jgi:transposase-like protein
MSEQQQPLRSPDEPRESLPPLPDHGREYTAVTYRRHHPREAAAIERMLGEGASVSACARAFGCSRNTVAAILASVDEVTNVEQRKLRAESECRTLARLCRDRARERLESSSSAIPFRDLAVSMGIFEDKAAQLAGEATVRIDVEIRAVTLDDYESRLQAARMGFEREFSRAKEPAAVAAAGADLEAAAAAWAGGWPEPERRLLGCSV